MERGKRDGTEHIPSCAISERSGQEGGGESLDLFWNGSLCTAHGKRIAFAIAAAGPRLFCAWMLLFVVFPSEREGKKDTCNVFSNDRNAVINDSSLYITLFETGTRRPTATWDYTARTTNESPRPSTAANTNSESALTISTVRTSLCILSFLFCFFFPRRLSCSRIYGRLRALPAGMIETGRAKHSSSRPHPFLLPCDEEGKELWAHFKFVFHPIRFAVWKMPFQNARRKLVSPSTWKKNISYANGARVTGTQSPVGSRNTEAAWRHRFSLFFFLLTKKKRKFKR